MQQIATLHIRTDSGLISAVLTEQILNFMEEIECRYDKTNCWEILKRRLNQ